MMWGRWAPAQEKTRLIISDALGIPFGAAGISHVGGVLMTKYDWRYVFWFAGIACILVGVLWHLVARDMPEEHPYLSSDEKRFIRENRVVSVKPKSVPYKKLLTSLPFLSCLIADMSHLFYINTSFILMPEYLSTVQGFSVRRIGSLLAAAQFTGPLVGAVSGYLADRFINLGYRTKYVRCTIQAIGSFLPGFIEQLWFVNDCNATLTTFIGNFFTEYPIKPDLSSSLDAKLFLVWSSIISVAQMSASKTSVFDICPLYAAHASAVLIKGFQKFK